MTRLVVIESPYAPFDSFDAADYDSQLALHLRYLRAAMHDCLMRGEAPYASHGLYTQKGVLDDTIPVEREQGIRAGFAWRRVAHATVVYADFGISEGMGYGIGDAVDRGVPVEYRALPAEVMRKVLEECD